MADIDDMHDSGNNLNPEDAIRKLYSDITSSLLKKRVRAIQYLINDGLFVRFLYLYSQPIVIRANINQGP
jgi:hypothetical protein